MSTLTVEPAAVIGLVQNAALLTIGVIGVGLLRNRIRPSWPPALRVGLNGAVFGLLGGLSMLAPGLVEHGYLLDIRNAMIALATVFGGTGPGIVATLIIAAGRFALGGSGAQTGILGAGIALAVSVCFRLWLAGRGTTVTDRHLAWLGLAVGLSTLGAAAALPDHDFAILALRSSGPLWVAANALAILGMGAVLLHFDRVRAATEALNRSEQLFRAIYNETPMMLLATEGWDRIVAVSDQWLRATGYSRAEVIGRTRWDFLTPESAAFTREHVRPRIDRGESVAEYEVQLVCKDGAIIDVRSTAVAYANAATDTRQILTATIDQTAQKQAERMLQRRNEELLQAHRIGRMGHWDINWSTGRTSASPEIIEITGHNWAEGGGVEFARRLLHAEDFQRFEALWTQARRTGDSFPFEGRIRRPDGELRWVYVELTPRFDAGGKFNGSFGIMQDITARKLAQLALAEKERQLRVIMDSAPIAIFFRDRAGRFQLVNRAYQRWFHDNVGNVIGKTAAEILPAEAVEAATESDRRVLQEGATVTLERPPIVPIAGIEHLMVTKFPIRDEAGAVVGIGGFMVDVSDRQRAEAALREKEQELTAILDNVPIAIFLKDRQSRFQRVNRCYEAWTGRAQDEIRGKTAVELFGPDHAEVGERSDSMTLDRGEIVRFERPALLKLAGLEQVLVTKFPIRSGTGAVVGLGGFILDVSAQKRTERELRQSRELLLESQRIGRTAYIRSDTAGTRVFWSETLFELRQVPRRDFFTVEESLQYLHPDDRQRYMAVRNAAVAAHRDYEIDSRVRRGDGSMGWEHSVGRPQFDAAGNFTGVLLLVQDITERKLAEQALAEKEQQLSAIMDNAPMAIFTKDRDGRYLRVNRRVEQWTGLTAAELYGKTDFDLVERFRAEQVAAADRQVLDSGEIVEYERPNFVAGDGPEYLQVTKFPIRDGEGRVAAVATILADISARRRAEVALRDKERELRTILDSAPVGIFLKDREHRFQMVNRCYEQWTGFSEAWLRGKLDLEAFPAIQVEAARQLDRAVFERGEIVQMEHATMAAIPGVEHVITTKFPVRDESGAVVSVGAFQLDVTGRRRAEQALRESEGRFRALIEHSNDLVAIVDTKATIRFLSPSVIEAFGRSGDEILGRPLFEFIHPDDVTAAAEALARVTEAPGNRVSGESRFSHRDGTWRIIGWSGRNAAEIPGVEGIIVNGRDVTQAKNLEEQLLQSQKMEAVGQLASGIAHDFNNILGAVQGFAGFLLQDLPAGSSERGYAQRIHQASERAKDLVQQILAFSRRSSVERRPTDMSQAAIETLELLRASLPASTSLTVAATADNLVAQVNAAQMHQILLNLVLNANDALGGEPGSIRVAVERIDAGSPDHAQFGSLPAAAGPGAIDSPDSLNAGALAAAQSYARITVTDTGSGMPTRVLKRIFDPFYTTKERGRGTGLGLAVVHGIVIGYDGACRVTSRPGAGTVFSIYIPLVRDAVPKPGPAVPEAALQGRERILIVDDEPDLTDVLTIALDRLGYEAVAVNDPEVAFEAFAADPDAWDIVISDQVMPKLKGMSLYTRMKQVKPSLHFILCTGFSDSATEELATAAGVDAFLQKPVSSTRLATCIRGLMDRAAGSEPATSGPSQPAPG